MQNFCPCKKHRHRRNVTRYHFFDYYNFHQQATSITGQLSSIDNVHQKITFINRQLSSIDNFHQKNNFHQQTNFINIQLSSIENTHQQTTFITSLTIISFIIRQLPSLDNFHQKTTSITGQLSSKNKFHQKTTFVCFDRQLSSSLTRVTSVKSLESILTHQSHINQVFLRYHRSPGSHQSSL